MYTLFDKKLPVRLYYDAFAHRYIIEPLKRKTVCPSIFPFYLLYLYAFSYTIIIIYDNAGRITTLAYLFTVYLQDEGFF